MDKQPLISVVVSVYNTAKYLNQSLGSLSNQTFDNIEFVIVNNGSSDNSIEIIKEWASKDNRFRLVDSKENHGPGGGKNLGILASKGIYIGLLDSDDYVAPEMYETLFNSSDNLTQDIVISNYYKEFGRGDANVYNFDDVLRFQNGTLDDIKRYICLNGARLWTSIIKRSLFVDNDLLYPENIGFDDNAIGSSIYLSAKSIKIINNETPYYYYRTNNQSETRNLDNPKFWDRLDTAIMHYNNCKRLGFHNLFEDEVEFSFYRLFYRSIYYSMDSFSHIQIRRIISIKNKYEQVTNCYNVGKGKYFNKMTLYEKIECYLKHYKPIWILYIVMFYYLKKM